VSVCWLDHDGIFGVGGAFCGWFSHGLFAKGAVHLPVYVDVQNLFSAAPSISMVNCISCESD